MKNKRIFLYLLCFVLPVGIMYLAYALFGVHPFDDGSVLVLDLNGQYVYYYEAWRDALLSGDGLIYNWSRNLSGNMFGIFAYYLASPFMLLVCIFPRTAMCGCIETIQLLKIGSASVSFAFFLKNSSEKARDRAVVIFSLMYSLMSYMVVQLMDPMWLDGLIYLPLICRGVKLLIEKGKVLPMAVPLSLMFMAHFYIGYMIGFFTLCYFVFCYFGEPRRLFPKRPIRTLLKFAAGTAAAVFAAAWVLAPVYNALKLGKLDFTDPDWSMAAQFDFLSLITKLFPLSYDTVYPEGLPMLYCSTAVILLVPLFFMNNKIEIKHKAASGILLFIMLVFMYIRPADIVWHGFQVPNWLPYRYSFTVSFLILTMAFEAFERLDGITPKEIGGVFFAAITFLIWCEREGFEHFSTFDTRSKILETNETKQYAVIGGIWLSAIALAVYFLLIYLNRKYKTSKILCIVTVIAVGAELLINSMDTLQKIDDDVAYSKYTSYEPYMSDTRDAVKHIKTFDKDLFYRMEATFHRTVNDPIGTGYYGVSHSSSVMNAPALTLLKQLGYAYGGHYTKYEGSTYITDSIFDIRYLMDNVTEKGETLHKDSRTKIPEDYKLATHIEETDATYKFYKNPYTFGLGAVCGENINSIALSDADPFENQNILYSALSSQPQVTEYFSRIIPKDSEEYNLRIANVSDGKHKKYSPADTAVGEAHIDFIIEMDKESDLYMYLPTDYERTCNVWVLDEEEYQNGDGAMDFAGRFFVGDNYSILDLGHFLQNEDVRVRVTIDNEDNEAYWSDELFYSFDHEKFAQTAAALQERSFEITSFESERVEGKCTADSGGQYLFTTIPDEPGWKVTVNGREVKTAVSAGALITVPLEKGENTVVLKFAPDYLKGSLILTLAGVMMFILLFVLEYKDGIIILMIERKNK